MVADDLDTSLANISRGIDTLANERNRYKAALLDVLEEAEDRADTEDRSDGTPRANAWMRVALLVRKALGG